MLLLLCISKCLISCPVSPHSDNLVPLTTLAYMGQLHRISRFWSYIKKAPQIETRWVSDILSNSLHCWLVIIFPESIHILVKECMYLYDYLVLIFHNCKHSLRNSNILNNFCIWEHCVNKVPSWKKEAKEKAYTAFVYIGKKHHKWKVLFHYIGTWNAFVDWYTSRLVVFGFFCSVVFYGPSQTWYTKPLVATLGQCNTDT